MSKKGSKRASVVGGIIFFITVTVVVTIAVVTYAFVAERSDNKGVIALVMFFVILFLALLCTIIDFIRRKRTVNRPVNKILSATDKIASGDFSVRMEIVHSYKKYDEYDYIMENLNKMAAALAKTEVLHNDFISNVSHEMKTPLAIIRNYATALRESDLDGQTRKKYAQTLIDASERLTALVTNILKLNKLENQELPPEYEEIDLAASLAETVVGFEESIESKNLQLDCDLEEGVTVFSARGYLEIVWNNLLSNAIKFTEKGGEIGVSLRKENKKAVVRVFDTGCGISSEAGKHIFEKFYQGDTSHAQEGNGLGLALVKKVIDIVGGEIFVESELNKGTVFTITLNAEGE